MKNIKSLLLLLTTFLIFNNSFGQLPSSEVDLLVEDALEKFNVAGTAVATVKDGKIIHQKGYGVKSIDNKELVNEHTNFAVASNSKAFTTAALALLVEEGKAQTIKMKGISPNIDFSFDFQDLDLKRVE